MAKELDERLASEESLNQKGGLRKTGVKIHEEAVELVHHSMNVQSPGVEPEDIVRVVRP